MKKWGWGRDADALPTNPSLDPPRSSLLSCPCHSQQSSCCLGMTGCHPSTESCSCILGREGCLFIPHHLHSGSGLVLDTGDTQSAPTVIQIPPTDLHPVCNLLAHLSLHTGSQLKDREAILGVGGGGSFTIHWEARNQTVHALPSNSSTSRPTKL